MMEEMEDNDFKEIRSWKILGKKKTTKFQKVEN